VIQNSVPLAGKLSTLTECSGARILIRKLLKRRLYEKDAQKKKGIDVDTFLISMNHVDRKITDGEEGGFAKVHKKRN